jgi:hypothetical protein
VAQPSALVSGPHAKKLTVPVGLPPPVVPLIVAVSVLFSPSAIDGLCGAELVEEESWGTVKHSALVPSLEGS